MTLPAAAASEETRVQLQPKKSSMESISSSIGDRDEVESLDAENVELNDPAILAVQYVKYRYDRDELMTIRNLPLSKKRPEILDLAYDSNGTWDPQLWYYNRKSSDTPTENGARPTEGENHRVLQRRSGDPRERIRKEQDGIVLSPQRRSFISGCFVPGRDANRPGNRPHSPLGKAEPAHISGHREIPTSANNRRIGSGRILSSWADFQEKPDVDNDFGYRRDRRDSDRDERFDRRSFGRDFDMSREKEKERHISRNGGRFGGDRRRMGNDIKEEEPEWFTGGPISQTDTIELRGFEDAEKGGKRKQTAAQKKRAKERNSVGKVVENPPPQPPPKEDDNGPAKSALLTNLRSSPPAAQAPETGIPNQMPSPKHEKDVAKDDDKKKELKDQSQPSMDLEDFLKCDSLSGFYTNGVGSSETSGGSRFSQWFSREKSPLDKLNDEHSRRSSFQEDPHHHLIKNLLNDIAETNVSIPGDHESYFAPISPAANTNMNHRGHAPSQNASKPVDLMEMLQRGKQAMPIPGDIPPVFKNPVGKLMSLEELEARMLHGSSNDISNMGGSMKPMQNSQQKSEDEATAFKKLIAQVTASQQATSAPPNNGPIPQKNMSLLEMLSHSQKQDEAARLAQMINNPNPIANNDLNYKFQQMQNQVQQRQQMEMLSKIMNVRQSNMKTPPLPEMGLAQSRELLSRPEAQAILQGLKRGDITPQHLYQQLANPAMQPRHRDMLHTILKMQGSAGGVGPSPRVLSPVSPHPHPLFQQQQQQQQQQLRVSPLPPNAYCVSPILATSPNTLTVPALHQRIPSPRELQLHTQNIMQSALIKKKLQEQQENFKKRQELQRGQSPGGGVSPAKNVSSPTPLTFTPTAVLRKMTADKDDGGKESINKSLDQKLPQGRPLTGMRPQQQQLPPQQQPQQPPAAQHNWSNQFQQQLKQPAGRPIVKANNNFPQTNQQQQEQYYQQQQQQQQQRLFNQQQQQQQQRKPSQSFNNQGQFSQFSNNHQQFPQLTQQQLRAQHQQQHHVRSQHQQQQPPQSSFNQSNWQHLMHNQQPSFEKSQQSGRSNEGRNIDLSPTNNPFARWFPPDLLERARNGKLPNLPSTSHSQHAVNLEEIERQTAPAVHN